jgi:hypothetical protein
MDMSEAKLEFSRRLLIGGNLLVLAWVLLAFFAAWFYNEWAGLLLLLFNALMVYGVLRRLGCSSCYACKTCTSGFGRIAGAFFGVGALKAGSVGNRKGLLAFIYVPLFALPAGLLGASLMQEFSLAKVFLLTCLCAFFTYSLATWLGGRAPK